MIRRFTGLTLWARGLILLGLAVLAYFLVSSGIGGIKSAIFGNPEVQRQRGGRVVAGEQAAAEAMIADGAIGAVREREIYREQVTTIVREGQGKVNDAWNGETVGHDVDAAGAAALCGMHDSLCRRPGSAPVQPIREPVPGADRARQAAR